MIYFGNTRNKLSYNPESVVIGTQTWALKNFSESTLINGTVIPEVTNATTWAGLTTAAWCNYANNADNGLIYGKLYNWYACDLIDEAYTQFGWRTPTDSEWTTLSIYLGGNTVSGGKLKATGTTYWTTPNTGATNESGFTCLPSGQRNVSGNFQSIGVSSFFRTSSVTGSNGITRRMDYNNDDLTVGNYAKTLGFAIRLIKI